MTSRGRIALLALLFSAAASAPILAQAPSRGTVEIAPYTGGLFTSTTFEDPDAPNEGLTLKSALFGADVSYYTAARLSIGVMLTRQTVTLGPATDRTSISATAVGGLVKYRWPVSPRVALAAVGGGGLTRSHLEAADPASGSATEARGPFALVGAGISVAAGRRASVDLQLRRVLNHLRVADGEPSHNVGGTMLAFGVALRVP